jgi:drug/metabolite transporter (DMT)-like permease
MCAAASRPAALVREVGIPALFVVLWSTGFVGAKLGLPYAGALTFLTLRYWLAAALLALLALAARAPWPRRKVEVRHYAVAGLLVHALYLGGVFVGISLGVEAGVSAMIVSVQPLLVAAFAGLVLGERVAPRQWLGLALRLLGVVLILARKLGHGLGDTLGGTTLAGAEA